MKQINRQTLPLGRSTKKKKAGLSLLQPSLFTVDGNAYKYYNESAKNISKFIVRLIRKKFIHAQLPFSFYHDTKYLSVRVFNKDLSSCRTINSYFIF